VHGRGVTHLYLELSTIREENPRHVSGKASSKATIRILTAIHATNLTYILCDTYSQLRATAPAESKASLTTMTYNLVDRPKCVEYRSEGLTKRQGQAKLAYRLSIDPSLPDSG